MWFSEGARPDDSGPCFIPGEVQLFLLLACMVQERVHVTYHRLRCSTEVGNTLREDGHCPGGSSCIAETEVVICLFVDTQYPFKNFRVCSSDSIFCFCCRETHFLVFREDGFHDVGLWHQNRASK